MKNFKNISILAGVLILQACGSNTTRNTTTDGSGTGSNSTTTTTTTTTATGNIYNLPAAPEQFISMSGQGGPTLPGSITISTSHTLKIKVTPQAAPHLTIPGYTNWVFPYGCLQISVSVNGTTQTTQVLKVAGTTGSTTGQGTSSACANAPDHQILDFSNAMTGSGTVTVTFSNPQYDNCRTSWPLYYGCSMSAVWMNHMVAFNAAAQTDGTWLDP